jgi:hypothetical protein
MFAMVSYIIFLIYEYKGKCSLRLINKHHAMKTHGSGGMSPPLLTSALDGGEPLAYCPGPHYS